LSIAGCPSLCARQFLGLFMIESISNDKVCLWKQDLVVGYMGVPKYAGVPMTKHPQYITVRNKRGKEMLDLVRPLLDITPTISTVCNFFLSS
jgi:hypothetical protein